MAIAPKRVKKGQINSKYVIYRIVHLFVLVLATATNVRDHE